jgi:uncharacterized protein (TIGR00730 family)
MHHEPRDRPKALRLELAWQDARFMGGPDGRPLRMLAEFLEPAARFAAHHVQHTLVFFGSARALPPEAAKTPEERRLARYYADAASLAEKLTVWSKSLDDPGHRFYVCTGGGPGIMEAANRGASRAGGVSIGLNIALPHEQDPNPWQTRELAFEFHYFFMRKFWFAYLAKALIVFPGGFGTMDELFELLTLVQTERTRKAMQVVLYGGEFWRTMVNFEALVDWGVIAREDLDRFRIFDEVDEAFVWIRDELSRIWLSESG